MKRAIEEDFPIVEINRLAVPERNAFKPIYQMHKWFARRASCVFRAILLGALKPAGTNIMEEFYKDHSADPDTNGKVVLDPFMGGGTTVVEALRLGCKVIGIDLNPVAWFIVKTEVEPVKLEDFDAAFERLANRTVPWSGRPLRETLLGLYKTAAPWTAEEVCGLPESDIIYTFWVKSAICTSPTCRKQVPLFSDYVVASKSPSIFYHPDCTCPKCHKKFDWEIEPATFVADPRLMVHGTAYSGGVGRTNTRWTYAHPDGGLFVCQGSGDNGQAAVRWGTVEKGHAVCPHCGDTVKPKVRTAKKKRKKVPLTVLLCPRTEEVFQWRGELTPSTTVTSPAGHAFDPHTANVREKGRFVCPHCGNNDAIIESIRSLPESERLPSHAYAMQVYAPCCDPAHDPAKHRESEDLFGDAREAGDEETEESEETVASDAYSGPFVPWTHNLVWKQKGKSFVRHAPADEARCQQAEALWTKQCGSLPYPKSEVPKGQETDRLIEHHYHYWHQMFNLRQLLALSTLLDGIMREESRKQRDLLLCAFSNTVESNNVFTRNRASRNSPGGTAPGGIFSRHDFQPKVTFCEQNVFGTVSGSNTFVNRMTALREGLCFAAKPYDGEFDELGKHRKREGTDPVPPNGDAVLLMGDSREELNVVGRSDVVITDPPYADNVNYAELADFFYVWIRLVLRHESPKFAPEYCSKGNEIVENASRGLTVKDFEDGLMSVLQRAADKVNGDGLVIFTFHHGGDSSWEGVLNSICRAGLVVTAIYPVHAESEVALNLMDKEAISYDLIHVCQKRRSEDVAKPRSWAGLRLEVRRRASEEIARIEAGRYGNQPLAAPDVRMVLIGKCLEVYSRHYGAVLDWNGQALPLRSALQDIRMMVEQIVSRETPLPSELENADALSQVWLLALCDKREISVDSMSKLTRGVFEVSDLTGHTPPILRKGRVKGGRTYEILGPEQRCPALRELLLGERAEAVLELPLDLPDTAVPDGPALVDILHLLIAEAERGERLDYLVERFRGQRGAIRAALEYLKQRDRSRWEKACGTLLPFYDDSMLAQFFKPTGGN